MIREHFMDKPLYTSIRTKTPKALNNIQKWFSYPEQKKTGDLPSLTNRRPYRRFPNGKSGRARWNYSSAPS